MKAEDKQNTFFEPENQSQLQSIQLMNLWKTEGGEPPEPPPPGDGHDKDKH